MNKPENDTTDADEEVAPTTNAVSAQPTAQELEETKEPATINQ